MYDFQKSSFYSFWNLYHQFILELIVSLQKYYSQYLCSTLIIMVFTLVSLTMSFCLISKLLKLVLKDYKKYKT